MHWEEGYPDQDLIFSREENPTARKEHKCCECGRIIKIGEKYLHFVGLWEEDYPGNIFLAFKTCLECKKDWDEVLEVFHRNGEKDAYRVFESLSEVIQDAFNEGFLTLSDLLVKEWLDTSELSPDERERHGSEKAESREAVAQMRIHSRPLF
jgi:hypothetical protein